MATIISIVNNKVNFRYFLYLIITLVCLQQQSGCMGLKLPDYIKPCSLSDSKLNECVRTHAQKALANFANGDPGYHIMSLKPLEIKEVILEGTNTIKLTLRDLKLYGLDTIEFTSANFNKNDTHYEFKLELIQPVIYAISDYEMKGKISFMPVNAKGSSNITFVGCSTQTEYLFDTKQHKGKDYLHFIQNDIHFECNRVYYNMKNLFGHNDQLGNQLNKLLNQNWKAILNDLKPAMIETMKKVTKIVFTGYADRVPKEDFFLP